MTPGTHWEVESTFDVSTSADVPDLTLGGDLDARTEQVHHLSATYYDAEDLRLTRAKITVRRRTGGKDDGWHIKLPAVETSAGSTGRTELSFPLTDSTDVPDEVHTAVWGYARRDELIPIARIDNERHETVLERGGSPMVEFCDDHVQGTRLADGASISWREWELELVDSERDGSVDVLSRLSAACLDAGATASPLASKLAKTIGPTDDAAPPASSAVASMLRADVEKLLSGDAGARLGLEVGIHAMRTSARNLQTTLNAHAKELAAAREAIDDEHPDGRPGAREGIDIPALESALKELIRMLGKSRDVQVVRARLHEVAEGYPRDLVPDSVRERIFSELDHEEQRTAKRVTMGLENPRYLALLDALDEVVEAAGEMEAPTDAQRVRSGRTKEIVSSGKKGFGKGRSGAPTSDPVVQGAQRQFKRFDKARARVEDELESLNLTLAQREELTHTLRKRNKALRRTAASINSKEMPQVVSLRSASERLHDVLGDVQDSVTARQWIRRISRRAEAAGEPTFGFGVLFEHERFSSERALEGFANEAATVSAAFKEMQDSQRKLRAARNQKKQKEKEKKKSKDKK